MSTFAHLDIEFDQGIATIVLNRPPANAAGRWADPHLATRR
jgi:enoyl-CoA hydratase/carnithine racemase